MDFFIQQFVNGILTGSVYTLLALGLTLIFGIMGIAHFAHGHLYMVGAYLLAVFMSVLSVPYWASLVICVAALSIVGIGVEFVYRPVVKRPSVDAFIVAIGMLLVIQEAVRAAADPELGLTNPYPQDLVIGGFQIQLQRIIVIFAAVALILLLNLFIKKTRTGRAIEAVAQDREGAALVGISANKISVFTFALATGLAAAAAGLAAPLAGLSPDMANTLILKAFVIIVIGGLGSIKGAIIGGYLLGIFEAMAIAYLSPTYKDVWAFGALILILAIKPTGIFGRESGLT